MPNEHLWPPHQCDASNPINASATSWRHKKRNGYFLKRRLSPQRLLFTLQILRWTTITIITFEYPFTSPHINTPSLSNSYTFSKPSQLFTHTSSSSSSSQVLFRLHPWLPGSFIPSILPDTLSKLQILPTQSSLWSPIMSLSNPLSQIKLKAKYSKTLPTSWPAAVCDMPLQISQCSSTQSKYASSIIPAPTAQQPTSSPGPLPMEADRSPFPSKNYEQLYIFQPLMLQPTFQRMPNVGPSFRNEGTTKLKETGLTCFFVNASPLPGNISQGLSASV